MNIDILLHFMSIALSVALPSLGVGIGGGLGSMSCVQAIDTQPQAKTEINKIMIIGLALVETGAIIGLTLAFILLGAGDDLTQEGSGLAKLGIAFAIGLPSFVLGLASMLPLRQAAYAVARQPFFGRKILNIMLITLSIMQSPIVFGFIISMLIHNQIPAIISTMDGMRHVASGLCIGIGSIGPAIGLGLFAQRACQGLGINRSAYNSIVSFTFLSVAIIETPLIFSLLTALLLARPQEISSFTQAFTLLAAALATSFATIAPGISSGRTAAAACHALSHKPEHASTLSRVSMLGQGLIDTCAIYGLLISLLLLFLKLNP